MITNPLGQWGDSLWREDCSPEALGYSRNTAQSIKELTLQQLGWNLPAANQTAKLKSGEMVPRGKSNDAGDAHQFGERLESPNRGPHTS